MPCPVIAFERTLTIAGDECVGSSSAKRWQTLSVALPCLRATNPKTLKTSNNDDITESVTSEKSADGKVLIQINDCAKFGLLMYNYQSRNVWSTCFQYAKLASHSINK